MPSFTSCRRGVTRFLSSSPMASENPSATSLVKPPHDECLVMPKPTFRLTGGFGNVPVSGFCHRRLRREFRRRHRTAFICPLLASRPCRCWILHRTFWKISTSSAFFATSVIAYTPIGLRHPHCLEMSHCQGLFASTTVLAACTPQPPPLSCQSGNCIECQSMTLI